MEAAFTLDDLPHWPHAAYPKGYTAESVADALIDGLAANGVPGVYAFCNSAALVEQPGLAAVLDRWVDAGHQVGNHTHGHPNLNEVSAEHYIEHIDLADRYLAPWMAKASGRYFRYTLNMWGDTEEKRHRVKAHLTASGYRIAEVTSFFYEWRFNAAYEKCLAQDDGEGIAFLKKSFIDYSIAQLRYDMESATAYFGRDIKGILLGHNVPFFAEVAGDLLAALRQAGLTFIPFEDAATDPVYERAAGGVCEKFLIYQQKLTLLDGAPVARVAPDCVETHDRVAEMARGDVKA
jgi:hypothetical protein